MRVLIFGGTAAYHLRLADFAEPGPTHTRETPYGTAAPVTEIGPGMWFSSRHGQGGLERSAAFVNQRASIWAARDLGVEAILSWNGAGAIAAGLEVGDLVVPEDVIDWTRARHYTFGEQAERMAGGAPFWEPGREALLRAAQHRGLRVHRMGIYVCTEGPRLETAVEIRLAAQSGAAIAGMTLSPEVWLAAELGMKYASLCYVTNYATGLEWRGTERRFGVEVAATCLSVCLAAAKQLLDDH